MTDDIVNPEPTYGTEEFKIYAEFRGTIHNLQVQVQVLQNQIIQYQEMLSIERKHQEHLMTIIQSLAV